MKVNKKHLVAILKISIAVALITYFLHDPETRNKILLEFSRVRSHPASVCAALASLLACISIGCVRWNIILKALDIRLTLSKTFTLTLIGQFFNSVMPGSVGGDLIKAGYTARLTKTNHTEAVTSVVIDRVIGLSSLIILTGIMCLTNKQLFVGSEVAQSIWKIIVITFAVIPVAFAILFSKDLFQTFHFLQVLERKSVFVKFVRRIYNAFYICRKHPGLLIITVSLSLVAHILTAFACFKIGQALELTLPFIVYLTLYPCVSAIGAIPSTPGGVGVREFAAVYIFANVGLNESTAFSLSGITTGCILFWSLVGGVFFMMHSHDIKEVQEELNAPADDQSG